MVRDPEPGFYPYFQEFTVPDSEERVTRKGFIALGPAVDYSEGIVYRHEQTLSGPKKDRLELLRHTGANTGQLFFIYSDPKLAVDDILDAAAQSPPIAEIRDEYDVVHRMWRISDSRTIAEITRLMADKKLLIADGHHRYETALAYRKENPAVPGARHVMMTLVNMESTGLKVLATHRLVDGLPEFDSVDMVRRAGKYFRVSTVGAVDVMKQELASAGPSLVRIGIATNCGDGLFLVEKQRSPGELDVALLHDVLLGQVLGINEEAVREQTYTRYIRGLDAAVDEVRGRRAQAAFLLEPTPARQVAEISFAGGVMPQKSTDFYPKLLSGLAVYKVSG
jgi:uncharacterized protein (DUF1015 family)